MLLRKSLTIAKSAYRCNQKFVYFKRITNLLIHKSFLQLTKYNIVNSIFEQRTNNLYLFPIFYKSIPVVYDITLFQYKGKGVSISLKALRRLTYLTPSALFFISTPFGIMTHFESLQKNLSGRLIALCVVDAIKSI